MFSARRQHPVAAITKVLEIIRGNFITILLILFVGGSGDDETIINLTWILGTIVVLLIWGILSWLRFTYRIDDDQLVIEQGVLMRKKLYISKDRIQVIDITSGIVQRIFGLVEVQVKTAGNSSKEAKISAVSEEVANQLREALRKENGTDLSEVDGEKEPPEIYRLEGTDLLVAATTSGRMGIALSIVGTAFSQVDQVLSEEQMIRYIESILPASASTSIIVTSIILIVVVSWILSFLGTVIKYAGFAIRLHKDELVISHGLFERKQLTIPYNRIQAIQIKEQLLRQPFGYASVKLDSAGYGDEGGKSVVLFPILAKERIHDFLQRVVPAYSKTVTAEHPPGSSLRRYLIRMILLAIPIIVLLWLTFDLGFYAIIMLLPALLLGYAQYRDAAIGVEGDTMILRYRLLSRNTAILKRHRVQTVEHSSNPFQRRVGLANFTVTVASGSEGHEFTIRYLTHSQVSRFWEWPSVKAEESAGNEEPVEDLSLPSF